MSSMDTSGEERMEHMQPQPPSWIPGEVVSMGNIGGVAYAPPISETYTGEMCTSSIISSSSCTPESPVADPTLLPVGTTVILREDSSYFEQSQGYPGKIIKHHDDANYCYRMRWENGHENNYRKCDIITIPPDEYQHYVETAKQRVDKLKERRGQLIAKYTTTVKISKTLYEFWQQELKEFCSVSYLFPFTYLLGSKGGIVTKAIQLRGYGGCKDLQYITPREFSRAYIQLNKKKLQVAGICRVGCFSDYNNFGIEQFQQLMGNDFVLISINANTMWIYNYVVDDSIGEIIKQQYIII